MISCPQTANPFHRAGDGICVGTANIHESAGTSNRRTSDTSAPPTCTCMERRAIVDHHPPNDPGSNCTCSMRMPPTLASAMGSTLPAAASFRLCRRNDESNLRRARRYATIGVDGWHDRQPCAVDELSDIAGLL